MCSVLLHSDNHIGTYVMHCSSCRFEPWQYPLPDQPCISRRVQAPSSSTSNSFNSICDELQLLDSCSSMHMLLLQQLNYQYETHAVAAAVSAMQVLTMAAAPPGAGGWMTMPQAVAQYIPSLPLLLCRMIISSAVQLLPEQQTVMSHHSHQHHHHHHQQQQQGVAADGTVGGGAFASNTVWQLWSWRFRCLVEAAVAVSPLLELLDQEEVVLLLRQLHQETFGQDSSSRVAAESGGQGPRDNHREVPQQQQLQQQPEAVGQNSSSSSRVAKDSGSQGGKDAQHGKAPQQHQHYQEEQQCGLLGAIAAGLSHAAGIAAAGGCNRTAPAGDGGGSQHTHSAQAVTAIGGVAGDTLLVEVLAAKGQRALCSLITCLLCEKERARLVLDGGEEGESCQQPEASGYVHCGRNASIDTSRSNVIAAAWLFSAETEQDARII